MNTPTPKKRNLSQRVHFADHDGLHQCSTNKGYLQLLTSQDSHAVTCDKCLRGEKSRDWKRKAGEMEQPRIKRKHAGNASKKMWDER